MESKPIWESRTFWFNVAMATVTFAGYLPPKYAVPVGAAGNIVLRVLTTAPVTLGS